MQNECTRFTENITDLKEGISIPANKYILEYQ